MQKKRLVVCFDGTWNAADSERAETNVARLARAVRANSGGDGIPQLCLYLRGVGTSGSELERLIAGATGEGIEDIIRSAYMFLAQNYVPDRVEDGKAIEADEIFLFGFSRGAFAARSLAGWLGSTGLLKRQSLTHLPTAWKYYRNTPKRSPEDFLKRNKAKNIDTHKGITVNFLGVWDTVGALGIPVGVLGALSQEFHGFHNTEPSRIVRFGAHALAIDEFRDPFVPTLWTGSVPPGAIIEQVWFAGSHADVGGGYASRKLADIPLRWMIDRAKSQGLQVDEEAPGLLPTLGEAEPRAPMHESRTGWSSLDRLKPTIRRIAERDVRVTPFERLYRPLGSGGKPLRTINESIHPSVTARWGRKIGILPHDEAGKGKTEGYGPKNLRPFFDQAGAVRPDTPLWAA
jgi:uncharacterized protein (DUF2235 family)